MRFPFIAIIIPFLLTSCRQSDQIYTPSPVCTPCLTGSINATLEATAELTATPTRIPPPSSWITPTGEEIILPAPLYYVSRQEYENGNRCPMDHIVRVERDGKTRKVIGPCFLSGGIYGFDFSPLDSSLAMVAGGKLWIGDSNGDNYEALISSLPDPEFSPGILFNMQSPAWSPDGTMIAYADGGIRIVDVATGERTNIIENECNENGFMLGVSPCFYGNWYLEPAWFPDGQALIFRSQNADYYFQMIYELTNGTEPERLGGTSGVENQNIAMSRDGSFLYFDNWWAIDHILTEPAFIRMDRDNSNPEILWPHGDRADQVYISAGNNPWQVKYPFVTPENKVLFFQAEPCDAVTCYNYSLVEGSFTDGDFEIRVIRRNALPRNIRHISWHESGKFLAFALSGSYIGVMEVDSGKIYQIVESDYQDRAFVQNLIWGSSTE
ncbi:MAG: hypothetical protein FVQ83_04075 [Chloroflexi bacterium]|nr:hypothetical protein [Chloroflexota bacterium]